jgi:hypothetical protein
MNFKACRLAALFCPLLLVAACGSSGQQRTAHRLNDRLQDRLAADIAAGNAALQPLPDGARVTLLDSSSYPNDVKAMANKYPDIRANVIEALLDPTLMRVQIADTSALPDDRRDARVRNVSQYFIVNGLASMLQPADPLQAIPPAPPSTSPAGLTMTISVQCPDRHRWTGYGSGRSRPVCD